MRAVDYEFLFDIEEHFWWFVVMRRITDTILARQLQNSKLTILDAGCGTGFNMLHFEKAGHSVFGFDYAQEAVSAVQRREFQKVVRASITDIPYPANAFDLSYSFEVIDEVSDSDRAIRELYRVLKPGGCLLLRLPAFEWLRSSHDADIGTLHRYTLFEVKEKLTLAGFRIERATYANCLLFPVVGVRRLLKHFGIGVGTDTKPLPSGLRWLDPVLRSVLGLEASWIGWNLKVPFGLSAICYAVKPK
ncbi:MAG TPA: class I SAM-dependent methyltransferase [Terriglobia bacterium]|nr:class I SAM-dependent methyltransferase [Terriglobia bacterium]